MSRAVAFCPAPIPAPCSEVAIIVELVIEMSSVVEFSVPDPIAAPFVEVAVTVELLIVIVPTAPPVRPEPIAAPSAEVALIVPPPVIEMLPICAP